MKRYLEPGIIVMAACLLLAACGSIIPATTPPQLDYTPGPGIVVSDNSVQTPAFSLRYPEGWRVVTGQAGLPPSVVLVAPDETSTISIINGVLPEETNEADSLQSLRRPLTLSSGVEVSIIGRAPADTWTSFLPTFEAVATSIK